MSQGVGRPARMSVYVINLDRSPQRWARISANLGAMGLDFERLAAVDAAQAPDAVVEAFYDEAANARHYFMPLKRGEVGCFLSHRKAWQALVDSGADMAVVLEDDVEFDAPPQPVLQALAQHLDTAQPRMVKLFTRRAVQGRPVADVGRGHALLRPVTTPLGTQAQMLNRAAAQALLAAFPRCHEPVDVALQRWWDTGVTIWVLCPNLVREVSAEVGGTTLGSRASAAWPAKLRREWRRPWFRLARWWQSWRRF